MAISVQAGIEPLDGLLDEEKHMGWLDENGIAKVELSLGQAPTAKFKIPNFVGPIGCLAPVPGSTQFICATGTSSGAESRVPASFGLRLLDLAAPEKSASVVGLGLGSAVADIKTHQVSVRGDAGSHSDDWMYTGPPKPVYCRRRRPVGTNIRPTCPPPAHCARRAQWRRYFMRGLDRRSRRLHGRTRRARQGLGHSVHQSLLVRAVRRDAESRGPWMA